MLYSGKIVTTPCVCLKKKMIVSIQVENYLSQTNIFSKMNIIKVIIKNEYVTKRYSKVNQNPEKGFHSYSKIALSKMYF